MKMIREHYLHIKEAYEKIDKSIFTENLKAIKKEGKAKDSLMRLRWDFIYIYIGCEYICKYLYPYLNDTHIDTALRRIFK